MTDLQPGRLARLAPFTARSASDKTDEWPFWFVADRNGVNRTVELYPKLTGYLPFVPKSLAHEIADNANVSKSAKAN